LHLVGFLYEVLNDFFNFYNKSFSVVLFFQLSEYHQHRQNAVVNV